ncbi:MAG TPA: fibronectin type III domain-containing protein [Verrucomicrobiae bacterium]|nr:fibronectin type III domain-containing protein [Verrucomicrobiae bacterium]
MTLVFFGNAAIATNSPAPVSLTLAWDASTDPSVVGYRLYEGTASQSYTNMVDVGDATTVTIPGLIPGTTYYFAVTAYDSSGLESPFSGEISYTVPTAPPSVMQVTFAPNSGHPAIVSGQLPAGTVLQLWATSDFSSWTSLGAVTPDSQGSFQLPDPSSTSSAQRFYRLMPPNVTPAAISGSPSP